MIIKIIKEFKYTYVYIYSSSSLIKKNIHSLYTTDCELLKTRKFYNIKLRGGLFTLKILAPGRHVGPVSPPSNIITV